jgi:hypothetical protein
MNQMVEFMKREDLCNQERSKLLELSIRWLIYLTRTTNRSKIPTRVINQRKKSKTSFQRIRRSRMIAP